MSAGRATGATPRPSATVVVLRPGDAGPEVLLVERPAEASFGANTVFPGGVVEPGDALPGRVTARPGSPGGDGAAYRSAAIRELFEETGVLLARDASGGLPAGNPFDDARAPLAAGELAWATFLDANGLTLAGDQLVYFDWWVTPRQARRRWTTRFFAARAPDGQVARHDGRELVGCGWQRPADALAAALAGRLKLPPPTRATLEALAPFASVPAALDWARGRAAAGVGCVLPEIVDGRVVFPGDPGYPADADGAGR